MNELGSQATVAVIASLFIQWLKKSKLFPWITVETQQLNRWLAIVTAFLSGIGIYATWQTSGTLSISGLTVANLFHALAHGVQQWVFQQAAYRTLVAPPLPGAVQHVEEQQSQSTTATH